LKQPLVCSGVEKETAEKIQKAIEAAGAEFIDEAKTAPTGTSTGTDGAAIGGTLNAFDRHSRKTEAEEGGT
jgi:hypothetical protein